MVKQRFWKRLNHLGALVGMCVVMIVEIAERSLYMGCLARFAGQSALVEDRFLVWELHLGGYCTV